MLGVRCGSIFLIFSFSLIAPTFVNCQEYVPVFIWENTRFTDILPSLGRIESEDFKMILSNSKSLENTTVLLFAEETLSPEDFALHDSSGQLVFSSISSLEDNVHTTYYPLVKNSITAVTELANKKITQTSIKEILDNPMFNVQSKDFVIIHLRDAMDGEDRLQMLARHDKYITKIYNRYVQSNMDVTAILTSYHSSWILSDALNGGRKVRQVEDQPLIKADNNQVKDSSKIYKNKDLLMYVNSTASLNFKGTTVLLDDFTLTSPNEVDEFTINSTLTSEKFKDIKIKFHFQIDTGYWNLANISIANTSGSDYYLWVRDVYAPNNFSYHCHTQTFYNMSNSNVNLSLPGFQAQIFINATDDTVKKFGYAYDCVGFMSAPIWSGLFITFIMALIMTFGLTMMMDIKTMDRFDDPKGKTITINATD